MKKTLAIMVVTCLATSAMASLVVPMDQQYNVGRETAQSPSGDAIYDYVNNGIMTFENDGPGTEGFRRQYLFSGMGAASYFYGSLDFYLGGFTNDWVDMSTAPTVEFDARFYQDAATNTNPYFDAPIFLRMYTYTDDGNPANGSYETLGGFADYSIVWATQAPWNNPQYPIWSRAIVDPNSPTATISGAFDLTKVSRVRFYGTDWAGQGDDFVDIKNFTVTPEPCSLALIALGGAAVLRRRR